MWWGGSGANRDEDAEEAVEVKTTMLTAMH